jgi:hypothetical protein
LRKFASAIATPPKERPAAKALLQNFFGANKIAAVLKQHGMQVIVIRRIDPRGHRPIHGHLRRRNFAEHRARTCLLGPYLSRCDGQAREMVKAGACRKHFANITQMMHQLEDQPRIFRQGCMGNLQPLIRGSLQPPSLEHDLGELQAKGRLARRALDQRFECDLGGGQLSRSQVLPRAAGEAVFCSGERKGIHRTMITCAARSLSGADWTRA